MHYRIVKKIGAGGMGEVYLAEDTKLKRQVALKFMPSHLVANEIIHARFVREAQTLAKLNHPNIVSVYDVSELEGRPFYVMELVEGESLQHFAHEMKLSPDVLIDYAIQICQGLGEAHRAGIVHRDIKSANIAVDKKGRLRLLDFGLAANEEDDKLTKSGSTLGTVAYMSPEQVSGRDIDKRSDLFSLGIVLYELIAGRTPFKRESEGATLNAIVQDIPEPLSRYKSNVSQKMQEIVSKLLEKDKELRYQSAEGVIADLKRLMYDSQPTGQIQAQKKSSLGIVKLIGIAAVALIIVSTIVWKFTSGEDETADDKVPRIAVKPFENLGSASDEYFADGITDEITSRLGGISGLGVISRTSSMKYKNSEKNIKEIGAELGVDYILDGTVRWSKVDGKTRVRISPKLIRVSDDRQLWSDNYERELLEIFAVQADIAEKVVAQLGVTIAQKDRETLNELPTKNSEAYELYLKALSMMKGFLGRPQETKFIKNIIDSSVVLDPEFALAAALQSRVYSWEAFDRPGISEAKKAKASAEKSMQLVPGLPQGHIAMGDYYNLVERDYGRALEEFSLAKSELHNDADLLQAISIVQVRQGKFQESAENARKAAELDPLSPIAHASLALPLWFMRSFKEAANALELSITLLPAQPDFWQYKMNLLRSWKGDKELVKATAAEALKHCDTVDFLAVESKVIELFPELPWEKYVNEFKENFRDKWEQEEYYASLTYMNFELKDTILFRSYADSLKLTLEKKLKNYPNDFDRVSMLGGALALLGECDNAVEYGRKGVEMMTVEGCHW